MAQLSHRRHSRRWDYPVNRSTNRSTPEALRLVILLLWVMSLWARAQPPCTTRCDLSGMGERPEARAQVHQSLVKVHDGRLIGRVLGGRSRDTGFWCRFGGGKQDGCPQADQADEGQDDHGDPVGPFGVGQAGHQDGARDRGAER
jgi:hypothetical protein